MKARITNKSELRLSDLTREYTFDIVEGKEVILASQVIKARPANVVAELLAQVAEYEAVYNYENDVEIGQEIE
jgi:hypothetical protein